MKRELQRDARRKAAEETCHTSYDRSETQKKEGADRKRRGRCTNDGHEEKGERARARASNGARAV